MHKKIFFIVIIFFLYINSVVMASEKDVLAYGDIVYQITSHCSLQTIGRFKQTCKKFSEDSVDSPYYSGILIRGINKDDLQDLTRSLKCETLRCFKYCAKKNDLGMFDFFYDKKNNIYDYSYLLSYAIQIGDADLASFLVVNKNFDFDTCQNSSFLKNSLLWIACAHNKNNMATILLQKAADVHYVGCYNKFTPLHYACHNGNVEIVDVLMQNGANIYTVDAQGESCLDIIKKNPELARYYDERSFFNESNNLASEIIVPLMFTAMVAGCFFIRRFIKK